MPAWLITLEKICKPLVDKLINNKITNSQFGFKKGSSCSIGKTMIYYKSKKFKFNKALLIDVRKAYDSVDRNILKECIENNFDEEDAAFLNNFIKIYDQLTMIINNSEIKATCGLPQGSALSPIFFNLYINQALINLNKINNLSAQAYADDLILQSNNINTLQKGYDKTIEFYNNLKLHINGNKSELISDNLNDKIIDKRNKLEIIAKEDAKYLGQIINCIGVPITDVSFMNFCELLNVTTKEGTLTRIAKIRLFHIYMKSKINHLIPLIAITGGIKQLWKTIREIIFKYILEYSTMPRERSSVFNLGYYEVILRPVIKFKEKNKKSIIKKLNTIYYFSEIEDLEHQNEIYIKFEELDDIIEKITLIEIKVNNIWKNIQNSHENEVHDSVINLININKKK